MGFSNGISTFKYRGKINGAVSKHVLNIAWLRFDGPQQIIGSVFHASVNKVKYNLAQWSRNLILKHFDVRQGV